MDKKPDHIVYGINEKPPLKYLLVLSFQHALIPLMFLTYPKAAVAIKHTPLLSPSKGIIRVA